MPEKNEELMDGLMESILEKLREKQYQSLRALLDELNPADIAEAVEALMDDGEINNDDLPHPHLQAAAQGSCRGYIR